MYVVAKEKYNKMAKLCTVNMDLLPIKLHFFFFFGAMGGVFPYMPILAKGLGISASAVGLTYLLMYSSIFFSKPIFGFIADYFQNIKVVVFMLVIVTAASYMSILLIPSIDSNADKSVPVETTCFNDSQLVLYPLHYNKTCMENALIRKIRFEFKYLDCIDNASLTLQGSVSNLKFDSTKTGLENDSECVSNSDLPFYVVIDPDDNFTCGCIAKNRSFLMNSNLGFISCFCETQKESSSIYSTYQFWVYTLLAVLAGTGDATVSCLSDSACYEVLGDCPELYGKQRLWATISWGIVTLIAGFLNDLATGTSKQEAYFPGFYLMLIFIVVDILVLAKISLGKVNLSLNICRDIGQIFSSCETVVFSIAVTVIGVLSGLVWNYEFWFLQELGADQTLLGLSVIVQSFGGEVLFFFFSAWLIDIFGYFNCVSFTLAAFGLRFGLYFFLENPWLVLPIELSHGLNFALFHTCMTAYASSKSQPGTEATMMGILGSLFEGLGVATGSVLGGVGFDKLGGRNTFLVASILSFMCCIFILLYYFCSTIGSSSIKNKMCLTSKKKYHIIQNDETMPCEY